MDPIQNIHVREVKRLITPQALKDELPAFSETAKTVLDGRENIRRILSREDSRLLVVLGPCSIHDPQAALDYANRLYQLRQELKDRMEIVMRVYFEKPRTTLGWKGLVYDPNLNGSYDIEKGLHTARALLLEINAMGLPIATEFLDTIVPQYISDLISWAAIGARTTESQMHRQMASGLSMPVGFKNGTDGNLQIAIDALGASMHPHSFIGIDQDGQTSLIRTSGNPWGHVVLRGGAARPNYDSESIRQSLELLGKAHLRPVLMVDCSHANSGKKHARQEVVWKSVIDQRKKGQDGIIGVMLESNIEEGSQPINDKIEKLKYGVSITDECISWDTTERLLRYGHEELTSLSQPATV